MHKRILNLIGLEKNSKSPQGGPLKCGKIPNLDKEETEPPPNLIKKVKKSKPKKK